MPQESNRLWLLGTQIFAIIAVLLGVVGQETRLRSSRPPSSNVVAESAGKAGDGSISKRLWEDPLEGLSGETPGKSDAIKGDEPAAAPDTKTSAPNVPSVSIADASAPVHEPSQAEAASRDETGQRMSTLILTVAIDGDPSPEAKEVRLRSRYAISSALAAAGYWSKTQRMRHFMLLSEKHGEGSDDTQHRADGEVIGRSERFEFLGTGSPRGEVLTRRGDRTIKSAYVVWLDKSKIPADKVPPSRIKDSLEAAFCSAGHIHSDQPGALRRVFFHLGDSDDYVDFAYSPTSVWRKKEELSDAFETHFLRATIPDEAARQFARRLYGSTEDPGYWLRLWRPTLSDADTAKATVNELCLRVPRLKAERREGEPRPRVVILIESDTLYSRAITEELQKLFALKKVDLECRTYLRGLDGSQADQKRNADQGGASRGGEHRYETPTFAISEPAQGTSQLDYLRLMAQHLAREESEPGKPKIAAVGVLGSDRWDKMLVLQAVRPELPSAVFFTTDLDSLYFQRDFQTFTRNLVVASAAGLVPKVPAGMPEITWRLPPLRDCYQTILVEQTWHALRGPRTEHPLDTGDRSARVYEIAAGQEVEQQPSPGDLPFLRWLNDTMAAWSRELYFLATFVGLGLLGCIMVVERQRRRLLEKAEQEGGGDLPNPGDTSSAPVPRRKRGERAPSALASRKEWCLKLVDELLNNTRLPSLANAVLVTVKVLGITSLVLLLAAFLFDWNLGLEDVAWASGTSIWPSILIRLVAFMLAISLLKTALRDQETRRRELDAALEKHLEKAYDKVDVPIAISCWELLRQSVGLSPYRVPPHLPDGEPPRSMKKIFLLVRSQRTRLCRVAVFAVVYLLLCGWLFVRWPTFVPARGDFAFVVERFILLLGVAMYIVHLVFCIDLHLSALHLIRALKKLARLDRRPEFPPTLNWACILAIVADFTSSVGRTLLYPLMVLLLMIVSRFRIFDNWSMHPSLMITFGLGAVSLLGISLVLVFAARELRQLCLSVVKEKRQHFAPRDAAAAKSHEDELVEIEKLSAGAFARWYEQPVVVALVSFIGVFGSTAVAEPLVRLLVGG